MAIKKYGIEREYLYLGSFSPGEGCEHIVF